MKSIKEVDNDGTIRYVNKLGFLHREDGPAVIWNSGHVLYFLSGHEIHEDCYEKEVLNLKMKRLKNL